jgi:HEAT repeat protein
MGKKEVNKFRKNSPQVGDPLVNPAMPRKLETEASSGEIRIWKFEELPISSFSELKPAAEYDLLPLSNDPALMSAIEQTQDEFEEDEEVRGLALRILTAFKSRNAAEALGQIALYDISSNLRSKAATTLAEFDHESVFENLLLACADPTREVRAAAARGLFRLSFDRADAWTRIAETRDEFRMRQAARAAAEADLVERSFDRLIHPDRKVAYEAFALTALLIKAGESERIFAAIEKHRDTKVKLALLHVLSVVKDEETLPNLYALLEQNSISPEIKAKADQIIHSFDLVPA